MLKRKIGAFTLLGELGRGGMGVVWEAWDERLGRRVAIKRLHLGEQDPEHQARFLREARTVAKLDHPSIVRILDLLEREDGNWIVLEYVPGTSAAARLRHGPLSPGEALSIARDVAEGLDHAHERGFLHRDLKSENVLVTPEGRARILDFGLAKTWMPEADESGLSAAGQMLGTCRSMSPEQVHGLELDPRSDLFAFGVLLYELFTGISPFRARSDVQTLDRVCRYQPEPVSSHVPSLPRELDRLIDDLLEKEKERRPSSAREVIDRLEGIDPRPASGGAERLGAERLGAERLGADDAGESRPGDDLEQTTLAGPRQGPSWLPSPPSGTSPKSSSRASSSRASSSRWRIGGVVGTLVLLGIVLGSLLQDQLRAESPLVVAVAPVSIGVGAERAETGLVAAAVRASVLRALAELGGLVAVTRDGSFADGASPSSELGGSIEEGADGLVRLGRLLAADEVLWARLDCASAACQLALERRRATDGGVVRVESIEIPVGDPAVVATAVKAALARSYSEARPRSGTVPLEVDPADFTLYLELERSFRRQDPEWDGEEALATLEALRRRSVGFVEVDLLAADILRRRHFDSREASDLDRAEEWLERAAETASQDPRVYGVRFWIALTRGDLERAEQAVAALERLLPGDAAIWGLEALLAERRGETDRALELMARSAEQRPSRTQLFALANLEIRSGQGEQARATLERLRQRFPEDRESLRLLAQLELLEGDPARAAELYRDLVAESPGFADLSNLGTALLLLGRWEEAAESLRHAHALAPANAGAVLNLADAELLAGREEVAHGLYRRVVELVQADATAGSSWQWTSVRAQAHAHLGDAKEAVAAIRAAERLAADNPQLAFEAAVVYAVVGDRVSARVSVEKALEGGVAERWFGFPWFDDLRPELPPQ